VPAALSDTKGKNWQQKTSKVEVEPFDEIEVMNGNSKIGKSINMDEPLVAFANRQHGKQIQLNISEESSEDYGSLVDHLKDSRGLKITFLRTVRMPDDDKLHLLPAALGAFPLYNVSAYADLLPDKIVKDGGVFLPMWQREALWIGFECRSGDRYALRVSVGRINAVSGLSIDESPKKGVGAQPIQDYIVVPGQEWLDGICVGPGVVRQFVAMPCKSDGVFLLLNETLLC
jgi:hypothetical protein